MLDAILRRMKVDPSDVQNTAVRSAYGKVTSIFGIVLNLFLFGIKCLAGVLSGSVSIIADAVNNLSDASSSIISLLGFRLSETPADAEHPYGHGRYEYIAALMVTVLILVIGVELFRSSLDKVIHPETVTFSLLSAAILVISIIVKLWMMLFNQKIGKKISSGALTATAADSRNDAITTLLVLIAALVAHFTHLNLDGWVGLAVAVFILINGFGLVKDTVSPMLGQAPDPETVQELRRRITSYPGVLGIHDLMVHDYGPGQQFASAHVEMSAKVDVLESHDIIDNIERDLFRDMKIHIVLHYDPIEDDDTLTGQMRNELSETVQAIDPKLNIHDLRIVTGPSHTNLVFDCVTPAGFAMPDSELKNEISRRVKEKHPSFFCVIQVEQSYLND